MKPIQFSIRVAAAAMAAVAAIAVPALSHAGSVTVNSTPVCIDAPTLSMTPAGDLQISCTPAPAGGGTPAVTAPSCTVAPQTTTVGSTATLSASCTGGAPTLFTWTAGPGSPLPIGTGALITVGPFVAPATYGYTLVASNAAGNSPQAITTVTVNAAAPTGGTASCAPGAAATGQFTINGQFTPAPILRGSYASAPLPADRFEAANVGHGFYFSSVQATQSNLVTQYSISQCPGDFTSTPECTWYAYADSFDKGVGIGTARTPGGGCTLVAGSPQYFVNVRNVLTDGVTPSCNAQACTLNVFVGVVF
jgi:hypothetical protein